MHAGNSCQYPRVCSFSEISGREGDEWRCALFRALSCRAVRGRAVLSKCPAIFFGYPPWGCSGGGGGATEWQQHLFPPTDPPPPGRIASAEVIWCALLFPARGLGSRRMALWGGSERGSWREAEQRGRKTLAFHSSFSQFILGDQLHAIRQLGVLFSFQLYTVGEAGKVIIFFFFFPCSTVPRCYCNCFIEATVWWGREVG